MKRLLLSTVAALVIIPAQAMTITVSQPPFSDFTVFDATPANESLSPVASGGYEFSGSGTVFQSSFTGIAAQPAAPLAHNYMAVLGGGTETITLARASNSISIYWGSIDPYNTLTVNGHEITGATLTNYGLSDSGDWQSPLSNAFVTIGGVGKIASFGIASGQNSFEFNLAPIAAPEASTWSMMLIGFVALGVATLRRRQSRTIGLGR